MKQLILIEWLKIKNYPTFWIMMGLFTVFLAVFNYGVNASFIRLGSNSINLLNDSYSFPKVWDNICYFSSYLILFIALLIIILITNEYQYRTNRQNVIDGWRRIDFYNAKWTLVFLFSCYTTLLVFVLGILFGFANGGSTANMLDHINRVFYLFVLSLNYYGFALLLATLFKKSGITIGMLLLYFAIVKNMLDSLLKYKLHLDNESCFLPLKSCDELLPFPGFDILKSLNSTGNASPDILLLLASSGIWIIIYYAIGRWILLRNDW